MDAQNEITLAYKAHFKQETYLQYDHVLCKRDLELMWTPKRLAAEEYGLNAPNSQKPEKEIAHSLLKAHALRDPDGTRAPREQCHLSYETSHKPNSTCAKKMVGFIFFEWVTNFI